MPYLFLRIHYMLLANKRTQQNSGKGTRSLFYKLKSILQKKKLRPRNRLNLDKNVTQCIYRNKKLIIVKEILHRNL